MDYKEPAAKNIIHKGTKSPASNNIIHKGDKSPAANNRRHRAMVPDRDPHAEWVRDKIYCFPDPLREQALDAYFKSKTLTLHDVKVIQEALLVIDKLNVEATFECKT